jgi:FKBP-type peptidyl-prolyl cis-trans isomerase
MPVIPWPATGRRLTSSPQGQSNFEDYMKFTDERCQRSPLRLTPLALLVTCVMAAAPSWSAVDEAGPAATASTGTTAPAPRPQHRRRNIVEMRAMVKNLRSGLAYQQANAKTAGVITLASGLQYRVLKKGNGAKPKAKDAVEVLYQGSLTDGKIFVRSETRDKPASLKIADQIPGLQEALQLMPAGSKWSLTVPPRLAYGGVGAPPDIGPEATLLYDIELVAVKPRNP